ncbi:protein singles bar [Diaphorina citri]|uniref:Protein singles bar n=1 Tax=Diaphorina citri TaxID=121845 RepID=A0A3Q0J6H3_DIACI|nr:protein singles bar [Diaphorina citri]
MGGHPIVSVGNGVSLCGVCHLCTCLNMTFLRTAAGKLKLAEIIIGAICQTILLNFGSPYVPTLGMSYESFLCAVSSSLTTTTLLTVTYLLSRTSCSLVRSSIFVSTKPAPHNYATHRHLSTVTHLLQSSASLHICKYKACPSQLRY